MENHKSDGGGELIPCCCGTAPPPPELTPLSQVLGACLQKILKLNERNCNLGCFDLIFSPFFLGGGRPSASSQVPLPLSQVPWHAPRKFWNFMKEIDSLGSFERIFLKNYSCEICESPPFFGEGGADGHGGQLPPALPLLWCSLVQWEKYKCRTQLFRWQKYTRTLQ